jgi:outer membrane protein assembly factor BamD
LNRRTLALLLVFVTLVGCSSSGRRKKDDPILRLSAAESLTAGRKLLDAKKYSQARPYFQHAFEVEPNSTAGREALLMVADTLYLEGGDANFVQAEAKYRDYQNRFPTSARAPYVQFQIANSLSHRIARPDRDQAANRKAVAAYEDLLRLYPTSEYVKPAREGLEKVRSSLAEHEFLVGRFYYRFGLPAAAAARLEGVLDQYPQYDGRDKALYVLGMVYLDLARPDDSKATFARLRNDFPSSPWAAKAPVAVAAAAAAK